MTLIEQLKNTGGPFFEARWKHKGQWHTEQFRLFRNARARCEEEVVKYGAETACVNHLVTDEDLWSI